ncbi:MAG: serine/threonine protein phosphatase [Deltaproteobacteria bacterium]|nr:serine/threonine protein phosphatase [Deltaproteobacteria bacterium]
MDDPLRKILKPIKEVQNIRGIELPIGLEFLQLIVTGPPGAGKSHYIEQIRGWPNEGYLDLTKKGWWKDQTLLYRPREVHLALPFKNFPEALTVFDKEWLEASPPPVLELTRIRIPPDKELFFQSNWKNRYIFEFLIPDSSTIFKQRQHRRNEGYFPVDENLSMEMVKQQTAVYQEVALYLHRAGLNVYIRQGLTSPPRRIAEKGISNVPHWAFNIKHGRPSLKNLAGWKWLFLRRYPIHWLTITHEEQEIKGSCRIAHDGKTFELILGSARLRFHPEIPLGVKKKSLKKNWIINTEEACSTKQISGFARIRLGETVIIGRGNQEYSNLFHFPKSVFKRHVSITNRKGDLVITPLDIDAKVKIVRIDNLDYRERMQSSRYHSLLRLRELFGGSIRILPGDDALQLLKKVNAVLLDNPNRPNNRHGRAGGLVELSGKTTTIIIGDLHAQVDNLLKILTENCLFDCLRLKTATLIILGDAVHSEEANEMENFDGSILMMDLLFQLKLQFPSNFYYIRGNHDSFSPTVSKSGIPQGALLKQELLELRGYEYVNEMEKFYSSLPLVVISKHFFSCHAGPPRKKITKKDLINIEDNPNLADELITTRLQRPHYLKGYSKGDVKKFRKSLNLPKKIALIVGHTPLDPFGSVWKNVGTIKNHHIIYSAHTEGPSLFIELDNNLIPVSFPAEPLTKLINKLT